jgi:hypothetical protein
MPIFPAVPPSGPFAVAAVGSRPSVATRIEGYVNGPRSEKWPTNPTRNASSDDGTPSTRNSAEVPNGIAAPRIVTVWAVVVRVPTDPWAASASLTANDTGKVRSMPVTDPSSPMTRMSSRTDTPACSGPAATTLGCADAGPATSTTPAAAATATVTRRRTRGGTGTIATLGRLIATVLVLVLGTGGTASAHTISGVGATNFHTVIIDQLPVVRGLTLKVIEDGNLLELDNDTGRVAIILGYQNEPYLRVGPGGVDENTRSTSTYINATRAGNTVPPASADDDAAPVWKNISSKPVAQWHDHSSHYMLTTLPPNVRARPATRQLVSTWNIVAKILTPTGATQTVQWDGQLLWIPGHSGLPWWIVAAVLGLAAAGTALLRRWRLLLSVAGAVLVVADITHSLGIALDRATGVFGGFVSSNIGDGLAWIGIVVGIVLTLRRQVAGMFVLGAAALVVGVVGGAGDAATLNHSTAPFAAPLWLARVLVSATLGIGIGVTIGCVLGVRRHDRESDRESGREPRSGPPDATKTTRLDQGLDISADLA